MAISGRLLDLPSTRTFWCIAYVICLTICASAFPVKKSEDYDGLYELGGDGVHNLVLKEEERRASAPLWFHRHGKASMHSAPMWFNRMSRSGEYNPEGGEEDVAKTPPLWFHRVGKGGSAPLWFHRHGRSVGELLPKDMALIQEYLEKHES